MVESFLIQKVVFLPSGGFALVFLVKTAYGQHYALKRVAVNNEQDLFLCRQEIAVTVRLAVAMPETTSVTIPSQTGSSHA